MVLSSQEQERRIEARNLGVAQGAGPLMEAKRHPVILLHAYAILIQKAEVRTCRGMPPPTAVLEIGQRLIPGWLSSDGMSESPAIAVAGVDVEVAAGLDGMVQWIAEPFFHIELAPLCVRGLASRHVATADYFGALGASRFTAQRARRWSKGANIALGPPPTRARAAQDKICRHSLH